MVERRRILRVSRAPRGSKARASTNRVHAAASLTTALTQLHDLHRSGALTAEEYAAAKASALGIAAAAAPLSGGPPSPPAPQTSSSPPTWVPSPLPSAPPMASFQPAGVGVPSSVGAAAARAPHASPPQQRPQPQSQPRRILKARLRAPRGDSSGTFDHSSRTVDAEMMDADDAAPEPVFETEQRQRLAEIVQRAKLQHVIEQARMQTATEMTSAQRAQLAEAVERQRLQNLLEAQAAKSFQNDASAWQERKSAWENEHVRRRHASRGVNLDMQGGGIGIGMGEHGAGAQGRQQDPRRRSARRGLQQQHQQHQQPKRGGRADVDDLLEQMQQRLAEIEKAKAGLGDGNVPPGSRNIPETSSQWNQSRPGQGRPFWDGAVEPPPAGVAPMFSSPARMPGVGRHGAAAAAGGRQASGFVFGGVRVPSPMPREGAREWDEKDRDLDHATGVSGQGTDGQGRGLADWSARVQADVTWATKTAGQPPGASTKSSSTSTTSTSTSSTNESTQGNAARPASYRQPTASAPHTTSSSQSSAPKATLRRSHSSPFQPRGAAQKASTSTSTSHKQDDQRKKKVDDAAAAPPSLLSRLGVRVVPKVLLVCAAYLNCKSNPATRDVFRRILGKQGANNNPRMTWGVALFLLISRALAADRTSPQQSSTPARVPATRTGTATAAGPGVSSSRPRRGPAPPSPTLPTGRRPGLDQHKDAFTEPKLDANGQGDQHEQGSEDDAWWNKSGAASASAANATTSSAASASHTAQRERDAKSSFRAPSSPAQRDAKRAVTQALHNWNSLRAPSPKPESGSNSNSNSRPGTSTSYEYTGMERGDGEGSADTANDKTSNGAATHHAAPLPSAGSNPATRDALRHLREARQAKDASLKAEADALQRAKRCADEQQEAARAKAAAEATRAAAAARSARKHFEKARTPVQQARARARTAAGLSSEKRRRRLQARRAEAEAEERERARKASLLAARESSKENELERVMACKSDDFLSVLRIPHPRMREYDPGSVKQAIKSKEVLKRFKLLAKHLHPDKNSHAKAAVAFRRIVDAKNALTSPSKLQAYLLRLRAQQASSSSSSRRHRRSAAPPYASRYDYSQHPRQQQQQQQQYGPRAHWGHNGANTNTSNGRRGRSGQGMNHYKSGQQHSRPSRSRVPPAYASSRRSYQQHGDYGGTSGGVRFGQHQSYFGEQKSSGSSSNNNKAWWDL